MKQAMAEVGEMERDEIDEVLERVGYGHLGCAEDDQPYVVPINYVYEKPNIYFYTTDGKKTDILKRNPRICLQVEEIVNKADWQSVVFMGEAEEIVETEDRERVMQKILERNPTLTPAISIRWVDNWVRQNIEGRLPASPRR